MKKFCVVFLVLCAAVAVQAADMVLVPNGDFALYKAGTDIRATSVGADIWVQQIGMDRPLAGSSEATFSDGETWVAGDGNVDIPGWITPLDSPGYPADTSEGPTTNAADLFSPGVDPEDGTSCMNVFGSWSGQKGGLAMTDSDLTPLVPVPAAGEYIQISAMLQGNPLPILFDLLVDGVVVTPDMAIDPGDSGDGSWRMIRNLYSCIPEGDVRIRIGIPKAKEDDSVTLTGSRLKIDNVSIGTVPEPATMVLLGLGGLVLRRRRKA